MPAPVATVNPLPRAPELAKRAAPAPADGRRWGVAFVFIWFLIGGIAHFAATAAEMSGVFELLGAAGLLYPPTRRWAGIGLFMLTIAVTPVHITMLQQPERFAVPYWALVARLPLQVMLLGIIAWSAIAIRRRGC
jgi:uncharacterized membrane protein